MNPITIYGRNSTGEKPNNLTVSRLWIGDARNWLKPVTLMMWASENNLKDALILTVNEEEFIPAIKRLIKEKETTIQLVGKSAEKNWSIVFRRPIKFGLKKNQNSALATIYADQDMNEEIDSISFNINYFIEGMSLLFPNGELK